MAKRPAAPERTQQVRAEDVVAQLFEAMHRGVSIRSFAASVSMPESTLRQYAASADPAQYARAREAQAHAVVDELEDVARGSLACADAHEVQARRLLVDALKWRASKLLPRVYGEKQAVEHSGGVTLTVEYTDDDE